MVKYLLLCIQTPWVIVLVFWCAYAMHWKHAARLVLLLMTSILFNIILKHYFQVPLPPHLQSSSYAFPSGHMQSATVVYGYLFAYAHRSIARCMAAMMPVGVAYALVYEGFHSVEDVLFAVPAAGVVWSLGHCLQRCMSFNGFLRCLGGVMSLLVLVAVYRGVSLVLLVQPVCVFVCVWLAANEGVRWSAVRGGRVVGCS